MRKEEKEIIEASKEFAKLHNIPFDERTELILLNAIRTVGERIEELEHSKSDESSGDIEFEFEKYGIGVEYEKSIYNITPDEFNEHVDGLLKESDEREERNFQVLIHEKAKYLVDSFGKNIATLICEEIIKQSNSKGVPVHLNFVFWHRVREICYSNLSF
jgi:hypothetical protein